MVRFGRGMHRRRRRGAAALVVLTALTGANTAAEALNRAAFASSTTTGVMRPAAADTLFPHTYWVFFPGFGIDFCRDVEAAFAPVTARTGRSFCVHPSTARLDADEIAETIHDRVDQDRAAVEPVTLYLYGISMGGMIAYDVARILDGRHGITIRALIFDSSPAGPESVSGAKRFVVEAGDLINRLPDLPAGVPNPLAGGPLNRLVVHLVEAAAARVGAGGTGTLGDDIGFAWAKATSVSSAGMTNQMSYIENFVPTPDPGALPYADFAYFRAGEADADTTVDVLRAIDSYSALVAPRSLAVHSIRGGYHASADNTVAGYREALTAFAEQAGLPTADDLARLRDVAGYRSG